MQAIFVIIITITSTMNSTNNDSNNSGACITNMRNENSTHNNEERHDNSTHNEEHDSLLTSPHPRSPSPTHDAQPANDRIEETHLQYYLRINFSNCRVAALKDLYNVKRKICPKPNLGILGLSRDISEVMKSLDNFMNLRMKDQKSLNKIFKDQSLTAAQKAVFKANAEYLSLPRTKIAILRSQEHGECILKDFIASNPDHPESGPLAAVLNSVGAATGGGGERGGGIENNRSNTNFALDDDWVAKIYVRIDLEDVSTSGLKVYKKLFNRKGKCLRPNWGIRGYSKDPKEVMVKIREFMGLRPDEQKIRNQKYVHETSTTLKATHKKRAKYLSKDSTVRAFLSDLPQGREIGLEAGFNIDIRGVRSGADAEDDSDSEEELDEHMGLAASRETREAFQNTRADKRRIKSGPKPKRGLAPTTVAHLGRAVNKSAEFYAWKATAKANDGTYLQNPPPGAPRRTSICISVNQMIETTKEGGILGRKKRKDRTDITIVATSREDFKFVMDEVKNALGRHEGNEHEKYDMNKLFRTADLSNFEAVEEHYGDFLLSRKNPQRRRRTQREVFGDVQNQMRQQERQGDINAAVGL